MSYIAGNPLLTVSRQTWEGAAVAGQNAIPIPGGCVPNMSDVFVGGACLSKGDFDDSDGMQIKLTKAMQSGTQYRVVTYAPGQTVMNATGQLAGFRNRIINGDMRVQQRASVQIGPNANGYGGPDRFLLSNGTGSGVTLTQQAVASTVNGRTRQFINQTINTPVASFAGTSYISGFMQFMEGLNVADLAGGPVAISFLWQSNVTGLFCVALRDSTQAYSYVTTFNYPVAAALQPITIIVPTIPAAATIPQTTGVGLVLTIGAIGSGSYVAPSLNQWLSGNYFNAASVVNWAAATNNYIGMTDLQLEPGAVATSFERRLFNTENALCQRYYYSTGLGIQLSWLVSGYGLNQQALYCFPVKMRIAPTCAPNTVTNVRNCGTIGMGPVTVDGAVISCTQGTGSGVGNDYGYAILTGLTANAEF